MVRVNPCKLMLFSLCFLGISSFLVQQLPEDKPTTEVAQRFGSSLGFIDKRCQYADDFKVFTFINFINSASSFFPNDTKARLDYISDQMNKTYGKRDYGFSVIQEGGNISDYSITTLSRMCASVAAGADREFPERSYMFHQEVIYSSGRVFLSVPGERGSNLNIYLQRQINNAILEVETSDSCICNSQAINAKLRQTLRGDWRVYCTDNASNFHLNIFVYSQLYIYTNPKNCFYGIYEN